MNVEKRPARELAETSGTMDKSQIAALLEEHGLPGNPETCTPEQI